MINDLLQERAALYVAGTMSAEERELFALVLEFHHELRVHVGVYADLATEIELAAAGPFRNEQPAAAVKARVLAAIATLPQSTATEGLVMSGPDGLVQWVNPAFSSMCGYAMEELVGKKLGPILQGAQTDRSAAERMRRAVHESRPCRETILNYHKNGAPYWVEISIQPVLDDAGHPLWLLARERELRDHVAA